MTLNQVSERPTVFVTGGNGPYADTREVLVKLDLAAAKGKSVLLKPNAGRIAPPGTGITTHSQVVAAAIDAFNEAGASVAVGESPIVGVKTFEAFDAAGITEVAQERDCKLIDLDEHKPVKVSVPDGVAINALKICKHVHEFDMVVSIPVMKMHMHTGVTLGVKNMKGCLWRRSKVKLHMLPPVNGNEEKPLDIAIADMSGILCPHFTIIDGTIGMEGLGPSAGQSKPMGVVVASKDAFAADAVACRLMGTRAEDIPHLRIGSARGYGIIDLDSVSVMPENWQEFISPFSRPPENLSFEFPDINILDAQSCSACQSTLFLFLKRYKKLLFDYFPMNSNISIAIGKGNKEIIEGTLCIGNCTYAMKEHGKFIPGCPPISSEIIKVISGKPAVDVMDGRSEIPEEDK